MDAALVLIDSAACDELVYASKHSDLLLGQAGPEARLSKSHPEDRSAYFASAEPCARRS